MKPLIASAVLLSVVFSANLPLVGVTPAFAAGKVSSSYRYLKGIGKLNYKKSFDDAARAIVLNDFNGDGYTDVGYAGGRHWMSDRGQKHETHRPEIFLNNRTGRLKASGKKMFIGRVFTHKDGEPLTVTVAWDVKTNGKSTLADITGDGRPDWLVPSSYNTSTPQKISIIQGKGKKLKVGPGKTPLSVFHHQSLEDIDGDGDLDLIVSLSYTHIFSNPGNGKFSCKEYLGPPYYTKKRCWSPISTAKLGHGGYGFANLVIDLDRDNLPEIVTANYNGVTSDLDDPNPHLSGRIYVWKNLDGKNFKLKQTIAGPGKWKDTKGKKYSVGAAGSKAVDIDGDGDLDGLFYYECGDWCSGTNPIMVLKNLGNGKVKRWQIINASPAKGSYVGSTSNKLLGAPQIIDLNGDKRPDLVFNYAANYNGSMKHAHKQIWMNKGNGKFKRLTTKIFAKVSGNSKKAKIVALHANKDKKIDWLVIWSDGTYGTLIAR